MNKASVKSELVVGPVDGLTAYCEKIKKQYKPVDIFEFDIEKVLLSPVGEEKLMIVSNVSELSLVTQNKILKTIEDCPARTNFLLLATDGEKVLNTIKSRCIIKYLKTNNKMELPTELLNFWGIELKDLNCKQEYDILNLVAEYNRRCSANCNPTNQKDFVLMGIMKCVKQ